MLHHRYMTEKKKKEVVKVGSVTLPLYPWTHPSGREYWRFVWHDTDGMRKYGTRATKQAAIKAARTKAREIHNGTLDLSELSDEQARLCRAFLDTAPTWDSIETLRKLHTMSTVTINQSYDEFIKVKDANKGRSLENLKTLKGNLAPLVEHFDNRAMSSLTVSELDDWLSARKNLAPRTRRNIRASIVTFFRWSKSRDYLPGETTQAEKMAKPIIEDTIPETYTADQTGVMLQQVRKKYLAWFVLSSFAGLRRIELYPRPASKKEPLDWKDFDWKRKIITIRPEVAKTKRRRVIHMKENVVSMLKPISKKSGSVCAGKPPDGTSWGQSETSRLGELVGGWKKNGLRDSFISYCAAIDGIGTASLEAGNSESEAKKSYHDAKGRDEAEKYFQLNR